MDPSVVNLDFDLDGNYATFINNLRGVLADNPEQALHVVKHLWLADHPLLPKEKPIKPARWIHIRLRVQTKHITAIVRDDNVYLKGFMNQNGRLYEFGLSEYKNKHFIRDDSTFLGCDDDYGSLIRERTNLMRLPLGMDHAKNAVRNLSGYEQGGQANAETKMRLASLVVMICESARMVPLYDTVNNGWQNGAAINGLQEEYTRCWATMSRALFWWEKFPLRLSQTVMENRDSALNVVYLLLNTRPPRKAAGNDPPITGAPPPPPPDGDDAMQEDQITPAPAADAGNEQLPQAQESQPPEGSGDGQKRQSGSDPQRKLQSVQPAEHSRQQQQQWDRRTWMDLRMDRGYPGTAIDDADGRPLVEVFSVRFPDGEEAPSPSGTVSVFDGRRGQIIYNGTTGDSRLPPSYGQNGLVLTGPYRAISADGCVAIVLDLHRHGSSKDHDEASRIYVDTYEPYTRYDQAITEEVETGYGGLAEVTYAVLSSAVEAIVEVKLLPPRYNDDLAPAYVQGRILARTKLWNNRDDDQVVFLFHGENVCDPDDRSQEVIIPLARSVLAVPTNCPLTIDVVLIGYSGKQIVNKSIEFYPQLDGQCAERIDGTDCAVEVKITWSDDTDAWSDDTDALTHMLTVKE